MKRIVDDLRPTKFEQVWGQTRAVAYLSGLIIQDQRERHILLHGQVGSGKTTLARIYAAALNCAVYDRNTGSPCGECSSCREIERRDSPLFREIAAPDFESAKQLTDMIENTVYGYSTGHRRVIFIDEAHALANFSGTVNRLLKPIENAPSGIVYILATSQLDDVPPALRSRFVLLQIHPLSREEAHRFLAKVLEDRNVVVTDKSALSLIAAFGEYQPRNMLQCLEQLLPGPITVDHVRQIIGSPDVDLLVEYFEKIAIGNAEAALVAFLEWPEAISIKIDLIRMMVLHIYLREFNNIDVTIEALIESISPDRIISIVVMFRMRVQALNLEAKAVWRDLVVFWQAVPRDRGEEAAMLDIALFHDAACDLEISVLVHVDNVETAISATPNVSSPSDPFGTKARAPRRPKRKPSEEHLNFEHVRMVVNAASACTQAYGLRLNGEITVWHSHFGCYDRTEASDNASQFHKDMQEWIRSRNEKVPVCRITTQEHDLKKGHCARTIVHVPETVWQEFRRWCLNWRRADRSDAMAETAVEVLLPQHAFMSDKSRDARHGACLRWLLASTDPEEIAWDPKPPQPHWASLRALLGLKQEVRCVARVESRERPVVTSKALSTPELLRQARHKMFFLSPFDHQAWDRLTGDWERLEYRHRSKELQTRDQALENVMSVLPAGLTREQIHNADAVRVLYEGWEEDARTRPRNWNIWWPQGEI